MSNESTEKMYSGYETVQGQVTQRWLPGGLGSVLEIGCSSGYFTHKLLEKARHVSGVDVNQRHIDIARRQYPSIDFQVITSEQLPYDDASFDAVVMLEVYEHVNDRRAIINEVHRVLKPGGILVLSTPNTGLFSFLDAFNLKMSLRRNLPTLFSFIERKIFRYQNTQYTDNLAWHPHFSLAHLKEAVRGRFEIEKVHRGGLLVFPLFAIIRSVLIRTIPSRTLFQLMVRIMNIDGRIPYGPLAYNLQILARKQGPRAGRDG